MNRAQRRDFFRKNKELLSICPYCRKKSVFATDDKRIVRCVLCGAQVIKQPLDKQGFIKLKSEVSNGSINCD